MAVPGKSALMLSVAAPARDDAWAIGFAATGAGRAGRAIIEHWSGRNWRRVLVPEKLLSGFNAGQWPPYAVIGASSRKNVWAFNQMTGAWLRWNGRHWTGGSLARHPRKSPVIVDSALVLAPGDVWALGFRLNGQGDAIPYAARFTGRRWDVSQVPGQRMLPIAAASAVSPRDIWAILGRAGNIVDPTNGPTGGGMIHWNGRRWRPVPLPAMLARRGDPSSVAAFSNRNIWVGGGTANDKLGLTETAIHWNGARWQVARLPAAASQASYVLSSIVPDGRGGLQALATCTVCAKPRSRSRLWRLSDGRWEGPIGLHLTRQPSVLTALAQAGHSPSDWATGFTAIGTADEGIIALSGPVPR